ncbi:MAG TPA: response regulator [Blastocatellia bacterium]|jgi:DNA-binding response OmpR family regulator|nr:response regulator [Blastocatellia bacterium]
MPSILLVDDDEQLRSMLKIVLSRAGHEVLEARNGKEALEFQRSNPSDLMITDLIMPEKEGLDTIIEFRRRFPDIKIIAMSGGGRINSDCYLDFAKKLGANCTLAKPFSNVEFLDRVQMVLQS